MIQVNECLISLDRKEKGADIDFISHAHSDHISSAKSSKNILASPATIKLLEEAKGINPVQTKYSSKAVRLLDAGHMLGSKQLLIDDEANGKRIVYTGDYQLQESRACEKIEIEEADIAIIDSTYCDPEIQFEDRNGVESALQLWTDRKLNSGIVLFGTYSMGKAQELIMILNEIGVVPIVSNGISSANKAYERSGVKLDYASEVDSWSDYHQLARGNFVGVIENYALDAAKREFSSYYKRKVYTAVATGFAKMAKFNTDAQFALSDHADFWQAVEYIEACGADVIYTKGQNSEEFAANLTMNGHDAQSLRKSEIIACSESCELNINK